MWVTECGCRVRWRRSWWPKQITISASVTNASQVCCSICSLDITAFWSSPSTGSPKRLFLLSCTAYHFHFFFGAWSPSKELILSQWMAEGCQANPVKRLLPCCAAPTTIQIGSWLQAICMLLEWHSSLCGLCVLYNPRSCLMSILLRATGLNVMQIRKKKKDAPTRMMDAVYLPSILTCSYYYFCTSHHVVLFY